MRSRAGIGSDGPAAAAPDAPSILAFFAGDSDGDSVLHKLMSPDVPIHVQSTGRMSEGTLILDQTVREGNKPPRIRQWRISSVAPDRYAGTLSDAESPVTIDTVGERVRLRYKMKGGLSAEQWLSVAADGRSARNDMTIRKFGFTVASLQETIHKRYEISTTVR